MEDTFFVCSVGGIISGLVNWFVGYSIYQIYGGGVLQWDQDPDDYPLINVYSIGVEYTSSSPRLISSSPAQETNDKEAD